MSHVTADDIADRLEGARRSSGGWTARCPTHPDRTASLSIHDGKRGTVLHCHAGCSAAQIAEELGFRIEMLFADYNPNGGGGTDIDAKLRELVRKSRGDVYIPQTLGAVMGMAFTGEHDDWFRAYETHAEIMDMDFEQAYRMWSIVADGPVFAYLERWWNTLDPRQRNWHDIREAAMRKLRDVRRERERYARGY